MNKITTIIAAIFAICLIAPQASQAQHSPTDPGTLTTTQIYTATSQLRNPSQSAAGIEINTSAQADQKALGCKMQSEFAIDLRGHNIFLENRSIGPVEHCLWNFGDGQMTSQANPNKHTFPHKGTYTVQLSVMGQCGITTSTQTVVID